MKAVSEPTGELLDRARTAILLFLAIFAPFALLQLGAATWLTDSTIVDTDALRASGFVNGAVALLAGGYLVLNRYQRRNGVGQGPLFLAATTTFGVLLVGAWVAQLHFGGSQSAHMGPLLLGTLAVLAWLLPRPLLLLPAHVGRDDRRDVRGGAGVRVRRRSAAALAGRNESEKECRQNKTARRHASLPTC